MSTTKVNIEGKTAFISGANRGIGKAITEELIAQWNWEDLCWS